MNWIDTLVARDQQALIYLNGLGSESWDGFWLLITNKWVSIPLYLLLLLFSVRYFGWKKTASILLIVTAMIAASDQLANLFKYSFERLRPCHEPAVASVIRLVKPSCGGKFGYFSAHAANSFALAVFFSLVFHRRWRFWIPVLLSWASLVAFSRIYLGVHYPLDVITGTLVGSGIAWLAYLLLLKVWKQKRI